MTQRIFALICGRGGSKGLPGKNIKLLAGKPLIAHSIDIALKCENINGVYISTDDPDIAAVSEEYGALVPFLRPKQLANDDTPEWLVWQHMLDYFECEMGLPDALVVLPPTAPLRSLEDVSSAINLFFTHKCDGVICATEAHRSPEFNMVKLNKTGACELAIIPLTSIHRRQDSTQYFDLTTVCYVMKPTFVREKKKLFDGHILMQQVPALRAIDIDTNLDFEWAEFLLKRQSK